MPDATSTNCLTTQNVRIAKLTFINVATASLAPHPISLRPGQQQMADWQAWLFQLFLGWERHGGSCPGDRPLPTACTSSAGCCHFTRSAAAISKPNQIPERTCPYLQVGFRSYPPRLYQHRHSPPDLLSVGQLTVLH